jgi:hypothetical protein
MSHGCIISRSFPSAASPPSYLYLGAGQDPIVKSNLVPCRYEVVDGDDGHEHGCSERLDRLDLDRGLRFCSCKTDMGAVPWTPENGNLEAHSLDFRKARLV